MLKGNFYVGGLCFRTSLLIPKESVSAVAALSILTVSRAGEVMPPEKTINNYFSLTSGTRLLPPLSKENNRTFRAELP